MNEVNKKKVLVFVNSIGKLEDIAGEYKERFPNKNIY